MDPHNELEDLPQDELPGSSDEEDLEQVRLVNADAQSSDAESAEVENVEPLDDIRTPRPLDLTDSFEVVRGVPAFVWRDSCRFKPDYRVFALSPDGTRMALMETDHKLKLYAVLDNFSVLAEGQVTFETRVCCLCFGSTRNDEIIAVHEDSCVTSFSIHQATIVQLQTTVPFVRHRIAWHEHRFRMQFRDTHKLRFLVKTHGLETWICAYDLKNLTVISLYSRTPGQHRTAWISTPREIVPIAAYVSIPRTAFMIVARNPDRPETTNTLIWRDSNNERCFAGHPRIDTEGRGFGWNDCGNYFVIWKSTSLTLFHVPGDLARPVEAMASTPIHDQVHHLHCEFLTLDQVGIELCREPDPDRVPIVAYLAASSSSLKLFFWDPVTNIPPREHELTVRGMVLPHDPHCEFCLSPNLLWAAIGCWTSGRFGLFSLGTDTWVWNLSLNASDLRRCPCDLLRFDVSGTMLFVNSAGVLHVFAPPCLAEKQIAMESTVYNLTTLWTEDNVRRSIQDQQRLIPKHILRRMFVGMDENQEPKIVDVAKSATSSIVAMLVREEARGTAFILRSEFQNFFTPQFRNYSGNGFRIYLLPEDIQRIDVTADLRRAQYSADGHQFFVFLYPDLQTHDDFIAVFVLGARISARFLVREGVYRARYTGLGDSSHWLSANQSKDGLRVVCMKEYGLVTINLNTREVLHDVQYQASISRWLGVLGHPWEESSVDVSKDGASILVGFDVKKKKVLCLRNTMTDEMVANSLYNPAIATHCWALEQDSSKVAFLEFNHRDNTLSSIGVHNTKNNHTRIIKKKHWYPFVSRVLEDLNDNEVTNDDGRAENVWTYGIQLDDHTGHLWLTAIIHPWRGSDLVFAPIGPHTIKKCLPHMDMLDYPHHVRLPEIESFVEDFGMSYFYMPFDGATNLGLMRDTTCSLMKWRLLSLGATYGIALDPRFGEILMDAPAENLLEEAIEERNEFMARFFLERIVQETCLSEGSASLLKQCFSGLWMNFSTMITSVLEQNLIALDVCNVEILAEAFNSEENLVTRLGTCNELSDWQQSSEEGTSFAYWKNGNEKKVRRIERRGKMTRVRGQLKVFGIADVCKIGLRGVLRSLLMQRVPSPIFKAQLVKWVLVWKWENIWKRQCLKHVFAYAMYGIIFVLYTTIVGASTSTFSPSSHYLGLDNMLLLVLILSSFFMLHREYCQLQTYIADGKELRPTDRLFGVKYYLRSRCNALEAITYLFSLVVIPVLHVLSCYSSAYLSVLHRLVAFIIFAICAKIWYYATAFQSTGALVLTVQSVIRYSSPFLALAGVVIVAFGISLFVLFEHLLQGDEETIEDPDIRARIEASFGTPFKSILTMFYAMLGTFDHEIFSSDNISSPLITTTFVFYLIIQLVVILNMLVAVMTNTFDRVRDTEEEELCIGRARLIDAYEAMLSPQQIARLNELSQKYLYVIYPLDEGYDDEPTALRGRPSTLERHIAQLIRRSQNQITREIRDSMNQANVRTESRIDEMLQRLDALQE